VPELGTLRLPREIVFGHGTLQQAGSIARGLGRRALIITDPVMAAVPSFMRLLVSLDHAEVEVDTLPLASAEVPLEGVRDALREARRARPHCVIGFGGGSSLDFAKLIALGLAHDVELTQCYGENAVPGPITPVIAIPTTAGTGSEVTPVAVLADRKLTLKVGVSSPHLVPTAAICDPELTVSCPPSVTAYAGIDALAHAIEAFTARRRDPDDVEGRVFIGKNALSDPLAITAVGLLGSNLLAAVEGDENARGPMLRGSLLAGMAFGTAGTAAAHALQYAIGAATGTPHGLGTGLLLPYAMAVNLPARQTELARCADALGAAQGANEHEAALAAINAVRALGQGIGLPSSLRDLGVSESEIARLAELALGVTRLIDNNPVALDRDSVEAVLRAAWAGREPVEIAVGPQFV
jgi:alcohol dehydrogenase class IV